MPADVSNVYNVVVSVTNPSNKVICQLQAAQYAHLSILKAEMSQRVQNVDEYIHWRMFIVGSTPYTMPNTFSFKANGSGVQPFDPKNGSPIDPGFRSSTNTKYGAHTAGGSVSYEFWRETFHVKRGGLWLPPVDPIDNKPKPMVLNYGEIMAVEFPVAPGNRDLDLILTVQEG